MSRLIRNLRMLLVLAGILLAVHLINMFTGFALMQLGLFPRHIASLPYIFTAPFLHADLYHLANNLVGLFVFGGLCLLRSQRFFIRSSLFIVTLGGLLVWCFGRSALHIGASGWVFGLWALCVAMAWVDRRFINIVIALFVIVFYGGMVYGVLPGDPRISFESHLFGAIAGVCCALFLHKR